MRKIIAFLIVLSIIVSALPVVYAAEEVSKNYFTDSFSGNLNQALATSSTEGYNGWVTQNDGDYESALDEGTSMTITEDPKNPSNMVLKLTRTKADGTGTILRGIHAIPNGVRLNGDTCDAVKIGMRFMYTSSNNYLLYMDPFLTQLRQDSWQVTNGTPTVKTDYPADKVNIMRNSPNQWIDIEFVLDYRKQTISLFADDELVHSFENIVPPEVSSISLLQTRHQRQSATTMYIDDLYVEGVNLIASYEADSVLYSTNDGKTFTSTAMEYAFWLRTLVIISGNFVS